MSDVEEMQAELRVDEPGWLAKPDFLERNLSAQGLGDGILTLSKQVALTMTSICVPPIPRVSRAARACCPAPIPGTVAAGHIGGSGRRGSARAQSGHGGDRGE